MHRGSTVAAGAGSTAEKARVLAAGSDLLWWPSVTRGGYASLCIDPQHRVSIAPSLHRVRQRDTKRFGNALHGHVAVVSAMHRQHDSNIILAAQV